MLNIEDNHTCVQYMEAQEARTSLRAHRDDERRVAAHERRWHAQERARQQREQREQREQQRPKPPSMEELQRRGEEAGVAAMARAAMVAVADVQPSGSGALVPWPRHAAGATAARGVR